MTESSRPKSRGGIVRMGSPGLMPSASYQASGDAGEAAQIFGELRDAFTNFKSHHSGELAKLQAQLDAINQAEAAALTGPLVGGRPSPQPSAARWVDKSGRPITVLAADQSFHQAALADMDPDEISRCRGLSLGDLATGLVAGPKTPEVKAALELATSSAGGYLAPTFLSTQFIDRLRARLVVNAAGAQGFTMPEGRVTMVRVAGDPLVSWRAENSAINETDPSFAAVEFSAKSIAAVVRASVELAQDAANFSLIMETALAGALAAELDRAILYGAGGVEPAGLRDTTGIGVVDMGTDGAAIASYAPLLSGLTALRTANAADPTAAVMAPRTLGQIDGLTATDGQPLRAPRALENLPFLATTNAPIDETQGTSEDASSILMGDFRDLLVGTRLGVGIRVLDQTFAASGQVGILVFARFDSQVTRPQSFVRIRGVTA